VGLAWKRARVLAAASIWVAVACGSEPGPQADVDADLDADADQVTGDRDVDLDRGENDTDERGHEPRPGPLTAVVATAALLEERVCDIDGDGVLDNAIANLGSPGATMVALFMTTLVQGTITEYDYRLVMHMPWVDDLVGPDDPDTVAIVFQGVDLDAPADPADDFSGTEPFYARWNALDGCGEPLHVMQHASITRGAFEGEGVTIPLFVGDPQIWSHLVRVEGRVAPGGSGMEMVACIYNTILELGGSAIESIGTGLTALEGLVGGGEGMGVPTVQGLAPDLDLDGDGLERVFLDESSHVESCIDGDGTVIAGNDCWSDPRMADGFSFVMSMEATSAVYADLQPGWEELVAADGRTCTDPPEQSLWTPR